MNERLQPSVTDYAPVNDLNMYYEIYGSGQPLVLLHGGMTTVEDFSLVLPAFAQTRQVIAFERQGHGHTADIDRPFSLEQWADDTAALLQHLKIEQADILGYSNGGSVALAFALRHPKMVRKLVLVSAIYNSEGYYPGILEGLKHAKAESLPPIMREMYIKVAPRPQDWEMLVEKSVKSAATFTGWQKKDIRTISAPTLIMVGDSDIVRTEHAVELYRLIPHAELAVLPATDHIGILFQRVEWMAEMITEFLNTPLPEETQHGQTIGQHDGQESDFPKSIGRPAMGALLEAGYTRLEQLTRVREADIKQLHGVGPKAVNILRAALADKGLSFVDKP
ncbi:MAG: alpha/beta fold hydrolase [Anaerolineae bacterium]|nr:alpha/beta fold hydrolase [Anaerolineae bacterium]